MEGMRKRDLVSGIGSYVAIGDSFTEGLHDPGPDGGYRGWADRVAGALSERQPGFRYANLAVRGKLLGEVIAEQLPRAVEMAPDLVSLAAGGNDILCGADVDVLASHFEPGVAKLQAAGCRVIIFTGFDPRIFPVIRLLRGRIAAYNMHLRGIADSCGCDLVDLWSMRALNDTRAWSPDRLHLTSEGHQRVALRTCEVLGVPATGDWRVPLPPAPGVAGRPDGAPWLAARRQDARWARQYAMPWVRRRVTGTSSGDGLPAKRPDLLPISVLPISVPPASVLPISVPPASAPPALVLLPQCRLPQCRLPQCRLSRARGSPARSARTSSSRDKDAAIQGSEHGSAEFSAAVRCASLSP
jgi:lysophospholipase L1-like esterase